MMQDFLAQRGYALASIAFSGGEPQGVLNYMKHCNPGLYYLLSGNSKNNCGHVVVCLDDQIIHDPSLDNSGIIAPMSDGNFWINLLTSITMKKPDDRQKQD